jgi:uncharacterized RDD family membrane protein YckC
VSSVLHSRAVSHRRVDGVTGETSVPADGHTPSLWPRRIIALCLDWAVASGISAGFFDFDAMATLAAFVVIRVILTATLGSSIGQRLMGLGVRRVDGRTPSLPQAVVRTLAVCLVIPTGITSREDGRGLHDVWAGTRTIRLGSAA